MILCLSSINVQTAAFGSEKCNTWRTWATLLPIVNDMRQPAFDWAILRDISESYRMNPVLQSSSEECELWNPNITGWWLNPFKKYDPQIGSFPQLSEWTYRKMWNLKPQPSFYLLQAAEPSGFTLSALLMLWGEAVVVRLMPQRGAIFVPQTFSDFNLEPQNVLTDGCYFFVLREYSKSGFRTLRIGRTLQ